VVASDPGEPSRGSIRVDQLAALNDEMAALARSGIPLERGLLLAGRELGGRLGAITTELGTNLASGKPLDEAIDQLGDLPRLYRAIVEAGLRSGRLAAAFEGMATLARGFADARRAIGLALLYPMLVLGLAFALFVLFVVEMAPRYETAYRLFHLDPSLPLQIMTWLGRTAVFWAPIGPIVAFLLLWQWWASGRSRGLDAGPLGALAHRVPWLGTMLRDFRSANVASTLAMLVDHEVPLPEAIRLASATSGDRGFVQAGTALAEAIERGDPAPRAGGRFPAWLAWIATTSGPRSDLVAALSQSAGAYRSRGELKASLLRSALPSVLMIVIGTGAVATYGVMLMIPLKTFWESLAIPVNR
jgi:general secretion pathway protein F